VARRKRSSANSMVSSSCKYLLMVIKSCGFCLHSFIMVFVYTLKSIGKGPHPCVTSLLIALHSACFQFLLRLSI